MPEVWLRGPHPGLLPLLQPVAHALLQAREEVMELMEGFPDEVLWDRPGGVASAGFHLQHMAGVLDRLFTYARGEALSGQQLEALAAEGKPVIEENPVAAGNAVPGGGTDRGSQRVRGRELTDRFARQVDRALEQLYLFGEQELTEPREVGRARLPSTVFGLLMHAAEHVQRHTGQLLVTIRVQHYC